MSITHFLESSELYMYSSHVENVSTRASLKTSKWLISYPWLPEIKTIRLQSSIFFFLAFCRARTFDLKNYGAGLKWLAEFFFLRKRQLITTFVSLPGIFSPIQESLNMCKDLTLYNLLFQKKYPQFYKLLKCSVILSVYMCMWGVGIKNSVSTGYS